MTDAQTTNNASNNDETSKPSYWSQTCSH